jgi:hypothetical protein
VNTSTFIKTWDLKLAKYSFVTDEHFAHEGAWYKQHHVGNIEAVGAVHAEQSGLCVNDNQESLASS